MRKTNSREFAIKTVPLDQHQFTFVSMEEDRYAHNLEICPPDRIDRVSEIMDEADLTVIEYFPPELEQTSYSVPILGYLAKKTIAPGPHYDEIAELGRKNGQRIGVADIANRPRYACYGLAPTTIYSEYGTGTHNVRPSRFERCFATPTDARRMLTAEAIRQEADRHPDGTHVAYVGAPAHVNRVARYVIQNLTWLDQARLAMYHNDLPGLDKALRIYESDGKAWTLAERHDIARRPMGAVATLGARISSL